jgi:hypothetical protein
VGQPKKITVDVDSDLLENAQAATKKNISETIRLGLKLLAASRTFEKTRALKGKVRFSKSWKDLKDDP